VETLALSRAGRAGEMLVPRGFQLNRKRSSRQYLLFLAKTCTSNRKLSLIFTLNTINDYSLTKKCNELNVQKQRPLKKFKAKAFLMAFLKG
jgi:hypothetical protein